MTDGDLFAFNQSFQSLVRVFPLRGTDDEIQDVMASYFKALRRFPMPQVRDGAEICLTRSKRFPKPAEWIESIPKARVRPELQQLTNAEIATYLRAERLAYDDEPCKCDLCRAAGVDHRFLRFVPDFDRDDCEMRALIGEREIVRGHWAHGEELRRWYAAKEAFWAEFGAAVRAKSMLKRPAKIPFRQRIEEIFKKRPKPLRIEDAE